MFPSLRWSHAETGPAATIELSPELQRSASADVAGSQGADPTTHERRFMALLAQGCTDQDVAVKLGWSRRTLQRNLRRAMHKLGARSRFEAGFLLARSGWLEDQPGTAAHLRHEAEQG